MVRSPGELADERGDRTDALSIADLYDEVQTALERVFPRRRALWVRGEIQSVSDQHAGRGHCYIDLVDPESARERQAPVLHVKCWQSTWRPLRAMLGLEGVTLRPGIVVVLRGTLDFYRPKAEIGLVLAELDVTALLGRLAAARAALLRSLESEGLVERNGLLRVPDVPLRVGLVASPGTEGYRDFVGQLESSSFGFKVRLAPAAVQGAGAPAAVAAAIRRLSAIGPGGLDVIVVVRGGGSKADLSAFDAAPVARAVATASLPVWTGIGHTGDQSVADVVANRCCITPTDCGRELAHRVGSWWEQSVERAAVAVGRRAGEVLVETERAHEGARRRMVAMAGHLLHAQSEHVARRGALVARRAPQAVEEARVRALVRSARLLPLVEGHLHRGDDRVAARRQLLSAYDVERQLERGYSLTFDAQGALVRAATSLAPGDELVTRFAIGSARSVVRSTGEHAPAELGAAARENAGSGS